MFAEILEGYICVLGGVRHVITFFKFDAYEEFVEKPRGV
jgi:hypothetical protein